ncbi:MAG: hypothetical protein GY905_16135 [Gammaproteobacteria bacterium]|nr:hypothetical protein [Gammaproteobacteria bacterium]
MPASSNFREAIREAQSSALIGPNVVNKALPYVGGGMVLTAFGVLGGLSMQPMPTLGQAGSPLFFPLFIAAFIGEIVLFFMASSAANNANNGKALPLLTAFSLLSGFTLSGIVGIAYQVAGMGAIGTAVLATGLTFAIASVVGRRMSDSVGQALQGVVGLGLIGLIIAMVVQFVGSIFAPETFAVGTFELMIAGFGTVLFVGMSFVDFYTMPRRYNDDQYLAGALGMYLTYINLFVFILRLIIALQGGGRRE